jgi:hypothetical protein
MGADECFMLREKGVDIALAQGLTDVVRDIQVKKI